MELDAVVSAEQTIPLKNVSTRLLSVVFWWAATIVTLVIIDDFVFGPAFWVIARTIGQWPGVAIAFACSVMFQLFLVWRGTAERRGSIARAVMARLRLERRANRIAAYEGTLRGCVVGVTSAILLAPVIGGELPPMLLWRQGWSANRVRRLAIATAVIYACEFAFLHAWVPAQL
jgi:hypothetical protein